ncbi:serine hydrolase domain-containing protein [Pseudarthrobacter sp. CCNWLW207]|uniref:serine hydrolase domain-containing protein n=1 Tax=Pseudarthrobacter sp. CCNWLW207 TaxID=3127468 RepID=UPI00307829C4
MDGTRLGCTVKKIAAAMTAAMMILVFGACTGEPPPPDRRETPGRYAALEEFSRRMIEDGAPAVLIEAKHGGETWNHAAGVRNLETREAATVSDAYRVGSITKSMVAVSVMKLVEEGKVDLDEQVSTYLPEFGSVLHPPGPVTVRQLLIHESGMPEFFFPLLASGPLQDLMNRPLSLEQQLAFAATVPWERKLAQGFEYSSSNYAALGLMVQRLRGKSISSVLDEDIAGPLGLESTGLPRPGEEPATMVHGYITINGERLDVTRPAWLSELASGGAVSTVSEVNAFYAALLQGRLVSSESRTEMLRQDSDFYGFGLFKWNDTCINRLYHGHTGDIDGYGTVSMTSEDGSRQLTIAVAYPPEPPTVSVNPLIEELQALAEQVLNSLC